MIWTITQLTMTSVSSFDVRLGGVGPRINRDLPAHPNSP